MGPCLSAWGSGWGSSWGSSWGALAAVRQVLKSTLAWVRQRRLEAIVSEDIAVVTKNEELVVKTK